MNVLFVAATPFEIQPLLDYLKKKFVTSGHFTFQKGEIEVSVLITGVGRFWGANLARQLERDHALDFVCGVDTRDPLGDVLRGDGSAA